MTKEGLVVYSSSVKLKRDVFVFLDAVNMQ